MDGVSGYGGGGMDGGRGNGAGVDGRDGDG